MEKLFNVEVTKVNILNKKPKYKLDRSRRGKLGKKRGYKKAIVSLKAGDTIEIDIPNRTIKISVDDAVLAARRKAMEAKGPEAWRPAKPRKRKVTTALRAYAAMATSADQGAVRDVTQVEF